MRIADLPYRLRRRGVQFAAVVFGATAWAEPLAPQASHMSHASGVSQALKAFVVIVHADNPLRAIEREELSKIFLKRATKWPTGAVAAPVDLNAKQAIRAAFTKSVHGKSVNAVRAFWQQQIFSGRDVPPPEKGSDAEVLDYVKENPGAVGYVAASMPLVAGVKTISIEGLSP